METKEKATLYILFVGTQPVEKQQNVFIYV